jgi:predicted HTH domain antitoxin
LGATVTTRVPDDIEREIRRISKAERLEKSAIVRRLLSKAIREWRIEHALEEYGQGKVTLWRAAKSAGLSLRQMMTLAAQKGVPFQYALDDLRDDFEEAMR